MSVMLSRKKKIFYYLTKRYAHPVVVFDGYSSGPSIKDHTHSRRTKGIEGTKIEFRKNTLFKTTRVKKTISSAIMKINEHSSTCLVNFLSVNGTGVGSSINNKV